MISIVVPVLNEEKVIEPFLEHLEALEGQYEVIVVDGGSSDRTVCLASKYARVISSEKGRAKQMNLGAAEAQGEGVLFLHADCRLPIDGIEGVEKALADPSCVGGCFSFTLDERGPIFRFLAWSARVRMRRTGRMTGDEGIFVRRSTFEQMGGYLDIPLMEDWELGDRLNRYGKVCQIPQRIVASARRFKEHGVLRTFLLMRRIRYSYGLGVPPAKLHEMYVDAR